MQFKKEGIMKISRRSFLKAAATGIGSATLTGLGAAKAEATQYNQVTKWDYEADVVVLGLGAAGLMTAITAYDKGADVLILEKAHEAHAGGNTRVCGQGYWCPSDSKNAVDYQKALSDGYPIPDEITETFHKYSINVTKWLTEIGADMRTIPSKGEYPEFPGKAEYVCWSTEGNGYQRLWLLLMDNALKKRKVRVMYETPGVELIRDNSTGEIRGVAAKNKGNQINVKAKKAVALCTGGFENNQEMIRDYLGMPCGYPKGSPYNTGDGIRMAMAIGADLWHMDNQAGPDFNFKIPDKEWAFGYNFAPPGNGWIWIAKDATRFTNEAYPTKHGKIPFHGIYIHVPTPLPVHCVFDETMRKSGPLYPNEYFFCWWSEIEKYKWSPDSSAEIEKGWIIKADTIKELAAKIGKDPDTLEKTVATWNKSCAEGNDPEFGRTPQKMAPIQTPPFYAAEFVPAFTNTQGGPRRNSKAQVLDTNRNPIPRLYSAGELGALYSWHYQGGGNILECLVFGRIAGEQIALEKPWG
jgi:succinate dehydrogenase/fumarate reductase flavoprotein subunit